MMKSTALIYVLSFCLTVLADGQDGKPGAKGNSGMDGASGHASVNFIPINATTSYPLYLPIINCDPAEALMALKNGANVNSPIYTSRKITPLSVALVQGCDAVLKVILENEDINNRPNFELDMFEVDGSKINPYSVILIGNSQAPDIAVSTNTLERIRTILPYVNDRQKLDESTSSIIKALLSPENKYSSFPNNIEAVSLIRNRIQELSLKN